MFKIILIAIEILLTPFFKIQKKIAIKYMIIEKENQILKRRMEQLNIKPKFNKKDKLFFALMYKLSGRLNNLFTIVRPETVLKWTKALIKNFWTFAHKKSTGRPRTPDNIRQLVLRIKNENLYWGYGKIEGELRKLGIDLSRSTIKRILRDYRKQGKVKKGLTWSKFIKSHLDSLYAMDFFTLDTIFGKRFYAFFIIHLGTRQIVQYNVTTNPTGLFVRQQIIDFNWNLQTGEDQDKKKTYLIHDQFPAFDQLDYKQFGITNVKISAYAPNMNAFAERFVRSIRNEAFDWFVLFNEQQIRTIFKEYIDYYNKERPHQGIDQQIPDGYDAQKEGDIVSKPILSGICHSYERKAS